MGNPKRPQRLDKVEKMPGMYHALKLISVYSFFASGRDPSEYSGDKGKEIRRKGVGKIAELWELSEAAEKVLVREWVEAEAKPLVVEELDDDFVALFEEEAEEVGLRTSSGRDARGDEDSGRDARDDENNLNVKIVVAEEGRNIEGWQQIREELDKKGAALLPLNMVENRHIYLDVTDVEYTKLRRAYKAIRLLRSRLGINKRDMKTGAPESINEDAALLAAFADRHGVRRKKIAEFLRFKIYCGDNPSGSYPLAQKYIKRGRELIDQMGKLEAYLQELTGIKV
jgi:hypothetical protein